MEWSGQGVIIGVRRHGESAAIVELFTPDHGRHAGVVRGGMSRKMAPILQPGAQIQVEWRARLEEHLGSYRVEPIQSRSQIMQDRIGLSALGSICAILTFGLPERLAMTALYENTIHLLDGIAAQDNWFSAYANWEMQVLEELGYGLDLSECAVTGVTQDLIYVSPKSGRAVSAKGAGDWADKLLPMPKFLQYGAGFDAETMDEVIQALRITGFFLQTWLAPSLGNRALPEARDRFVASLQRKSQKT